jgi:hypothetical protein
MKIQNQKTEARIAHWTVLRKGMTGFRMNSDIEVMHHKNGLYLFRLIDPTNLAL